MAVDQDHAAAGGIWNQDWCRWEWRDDQARLHRVDGPAVITDDNDQHWFLHGQRHRINGPAVIGADGYQAWHRHDEMHRINGPAVIFTDDARNEWYVNNRKITQEVTAWMAEQGITLPFTAEQQAEFVLRWL